MAVLEPDSDDKNSDFFVENIAHEHNIDEAKVTDIKEEPPTTNSSEPLTDQIIKKNLKETRYLHMPSIALGAGIAISCLVLGIFLGNFIDEKDSQPLVESPTITNIEEWQNAQKLAALIENGSPILGNIDAPLTLVEFGDYQCSFCKKHFVQTHDLIMKNYVATGNVKILFKDMIVTSGEGSMKAAHAAHCAKDQGMFWKYHYMLYNNWEGENTGWITDDSLNKFASNIDLDMNEFSKCMSDNKWMNLIKASVEDANTMSVTGTPSFFLIGPENEISKIHGAQPYEAFKRTIDSILKK
jgi:protein-disulfide isomerase